MLLLWLVVIFLSSSFKNVKTFTYEETSYLIRKIENENWFFLTFLVPTVEQKTSLGKQLIQWLCAFEHEPSNVLLIFQ